MTKTNLMLATALALVLAACAKQEAPAPAAADASVDAAEAAGEAVADAATGSDLPQACSDYLARARACFENSRDHRNHAIRPSRAATTTYCTTSRTGSTSCQLSRRM